MDCTNKNCPAYAKCLAPYRGSRCKATRATYGLGDPITNADRIRSADTEIEMVDIILKLVKKIPEGENKRRTLYQLLMQEAENG